MNHPGLTKEEQDYVALLRDPVRWAETFLRNPENPKEPLKLRWYQRKVLQEPNKRRVLRMGRRSGKTVSLIVDMVHKSFVNANKDTILICPSESQVNEIWDTLEKIVADSDVVKNSIVKMKREPFTIHFGNGSKIKGFTAGVKSGSKAMGVRGTGGDFIYLDEADYLDDDSMATIQPLFMTRRDTMVWASSTPSGRRSYFYNWCMDKSLGWAHFHFPSSFAPNWVSLEEARSKGLPDFESTEFQFRRTNTTDVYEHEYEAEFGEETAGVFKHAHIEQCAHRYRYDDLVIDRDNVYVLGVDWNGDTAGVQLVVIEYITKDCDLVYQDDAVQDYSINGKGRFRVFMRESISSSDSTQRKAVDRIIELNKQFHFKYIAPDSGFGTFQIEELKAYGKRNPRSGMDKKVIPVAFGGKSKIKDPITRKDVEKWTKPYMVGITQRIVEDHDLIVSRTEEDGKFSLMGQLKEYRVKTTSAATDRPTYVTGNDHILDAMMCALFVLHMNHSEFTHVQHSSVVHHTSGENLMPGVGQVKPRWEDNRVQIAMRERQPAFQDMVPQDMNYSYTQDPRSQRDHPNTKFLIQRKAAQNNSSGPWAASSVRKTSRSILKGRSTSSRSIFGAKRKPTALGRLY